MRLVTLILAATLSFGADRTVRIDHRMFPGLEEMDGNWGALLAASDGKVYAGLANHGGGGHLVYYDSKTDRMIDVGNLNDLTGEAPAPDLQRLSDTRMSECLTAAVVPRRPAVALDRAYHDEAGNNGCFDADRTN